MIWGKTSAGVAGLVAQCQDLRDVDTTFVLVT